VIFGHVGLDGFQYISDIWSGGLVGTTVRLKFWRYPAAEVPSDRDELITWLYDRWQELDDWIGEVRSGASGASRTKAAASDRSHVAIREAWSSSGTCVVQCEQAQLRTRTEFRISRREPA
jgi:hypothetical protein